jgi:hypothetical protein
MPDHRHPQRPIAMEVESLERPARHEIGCGPRHVVPIGVIGDRQDVQAHLPRPGDLLARSARAVGPQPHPQGRVPAHQAAQPGRRVLDGAALGQIEPSAHAELVTTFPHILQDRLLAPGQRLGAGLVAGEPDNQPVLTEPLERTQRHRTCQSPADH